MFNWILSTSLEKHYRSSSSPVFWRISPNLQENTCLYDERDSGTNVFTDVLEHRHQMCSIKKLLLKFLQYSQENTCVRFFFLTKLKSVNTAKFPGTSTLKNICERLLVSEVRDVFTTNLCVLWWSFFAKIANGFQMLLQKSCIINVWQSSKYVVNSFMTEVPII